jgi:hypothetical protein
MYDFYMYLKHIEHSPENLEFYVWYVKQQPPFCYTKTDDYRFKNYEAGRLTGSMSRPHSKANNHSEFDLPSGKSSISYHDDKSGNLSTTESQEQLNFDQGKSSSSLG